MNDLLPNGDPVAERELCTNLALKLTKTQERVISYHEVKKARNGRMLLVDPDKRTDLVDADVLETVMGNFGLEESQKNTVREYLCSQGRVFTREATIPPDAATEFARSWRPSNEQTAIGAVLLVQAVILVGVILLWIGLKLPRLSLPSNPLPGVNRWLMALFVIAMIATVVAWFRYRDEADEASRTWWRFNTSRSAPLLGAVAVLLLLVILWPGMRIRSSPLATRDINLPPPAIVTKPMAIPPAPLPAPSVAAQPAPPVMVTPAPSSPVVVIPTMQYATKGDVAAANQRVTDMKEQLIYPLDRRVTQLETKKAVTVTKTASSARAKPATRKSTAVRRSSVPSQPRVNNHVVWLPRKER